LNIPDNDAVTNLCLGLLYAYSESTLKGLKLEPCEGCGSRVELEAGYGLCYVCLVDDGIAV